MLIDMTSGRLRGAVVLSIAIAMLAGCGHHGKSVDHSRPPAVDHQITVYFCKPGGDTLVATHFTAANRLAADALAQYVVAQWLSGPPNPDSALLVLPPDTRARVTQSAGIVDVDLSGAVTKRYTGGSGDEAGLFKSLTFTLTELPGVKAVQVRLNGQVVAALPGGHLSLDEPLTRETFAQ